jgi:hypothetical protein
MARNSSVINHASAPASIAITRSGAWDRAIARRNWRRNPFIPRSSKRRHLIFRVADLFRILVGLNRTGQACGLFDMFGGLVFGLGRLRPFGSFFDRRLSGHWTSPLSSSKDGLSTGAPCAWFQWRPVQPLRQGPRLHPGGRAAGILKRPVEQTPDQCA